MNEIAAAIVFYNKATVTKKAIEAVATAGSPVYVLDNGSDADASEALRAFCQSFSNIRFLKSSENLGPAGGRNRLIKVSREPWLLFLDNDVLINEREWTYVLKEMIHKNPNAEAFALPIVNSWDNTRVRPARLVINEGTVVFDDPRDERTNVFPGGGVLISRSVFDRLGMFDSDLWAFEEAELALRAMFSGVPLEVRLADGPLLEHRHQFAEAAADRKAVRTRYDVDRIGKARKKIEDRYNVLFERKYARWVRAQARDHLVPPMRRKLERMLLSAARSLRRLWRAGGH